MAKKQIKSKTIEETLWETVNYLRGSVEPSEYKYVVLSLTFQKRPVATEGREQIAVERTFSLSQMNNVELARTLSWRENVLLENEKRTINLFTSSLALLLTCQLVNLISCQLFGRKFNIESALFVHQSPSLPQKIDSREGLFRC